MSIILAAMAPVMTTRSKADSSSPWRYSPENLSDAYFGAGDSQIAMIGQPNKLETDDAAKLIINTSASLPVHMSFKRDNTTVGRLQFVNNNLVLGSGSMDHLTTGGRNNISIGDSNLTQVTSGSRNVAIGVWTLNKNTNGSDNIAIGNESLRDLGGNRNIAIGRQSNFSTLHSIEPSDSIAIGSGALATFNSAIAIGTSSNSIGEEVIAIGAKSEADSGIAIGHDAKSLSSIAIGSNADVRASGAVGIGDMVSVKFLTDNAIAIGTRANTGESYAMAIGHEANAHAYESIAIGRNASADYNNAIAVGTNARAYDRESIAIGTTACAPNGNIVIGSRTGLCADNVLNLSNSIAIGNEAILGNRSVAIGDYAGTSKSNTTAIGYGACRYVTGSNVVCIGADSGPTPYDMDKSKEHMVYLGTSSDTVYIPGNLVVDGHVLLGNYSGSYVAMRTSHKGDMSDQSSQSKIGFARSEDWHGDDDNFSLTNPSSLSSSGKEFFEDYLSDRRLKYVGQASQSGLDKIKQLKVFNYTFKRDKKKTPHVGVIAQDLQKVFPDAVKKGKDGFLTIRFEDMFFAMINAIKELDARQTALEKENQELKTRIEKLEAKIK